MGKFNLCQSFIISNYHSSFLSLLYYRYFKFLHWVVQAFLHPASRDCGAKVGSWSFETGSIATTTTSSRAFAGRAPIALLCADYGNLKANKTSTRDAGRKPPLKRARVEGDITLAAARDSTANPSSSLPIDHFTQCLEKHVFPHVDAPISRLSAEEVNTLEIGKRVSSCIPDAAWP